MFKSLYWRITLAFMLVAFTTAALVGVFIRLSSADRLTQLIIDQQRSSLEQVLSSYYTENGSWNGVAQDWREIQPKAFQAAGQNGLHSITHLPATTVRAISWVWRPRMAR